MNREVKTPNKIYCYHLTFEVDSVILNFNLHKNFGLTRTKTQVLCYLGWTKSSGDIKKKTKQRDIFHFILPNARKGRHDYLYKVPSFLTVYQNVVLYSSSEIFFTTFDTARANDFSFT